MGELFTVLVGEFMRCLFVELVICLFVGFHRSLIHSQLLIFTFLIPYSIFLIFHLRVRCHRSLVSWNTNPKTPYFLILNKKCKTQSTAPKPQQLTTEYQIRSTTARWFPPSAGRPGIWWVWRRCCRVDSFLRPFVAPCPKRRNHAPASACWLY